MYFENFTFWHFYFSDKNDFTNPFSGGISPDFGVWSKNTATYPLWATFVWEPAMASPDF